MKKRHPACLLGACMLMTAGAGAQETNLGRAVQEVGTELQINTGDAVQTVCGQLGMRNTQAALTGDALDLFERCREMVQTGNQLEMIDGPTTFALDLTAGELAAALQQLTGEENASKGRLATETSNGQFANIGLRVDAIARGARATTGPLTLSMGGQDFNLDALPPTGGSAGEPGDAGGWGWFTIGSLGSGDRDSSSREDAYDYDSYGATLGTDYQFQNGLVLGAALGYTSFDVDFADLSASTASTIAGGGIETDGFSVSTFGVYDIGQFTLDGILSYGNNDYDLDRIVRYDAVNRALTGETDSSQWAAGLALGRTFAWGATSLYVEGGFSSLDITIDGYTEVDPVGGLNLAYEDQDIESLQSALGFQLTRAFGVARGVIVPYFQAYWRHEFDNDSQLLVARYAAFDAAFPELAGDDSFNLVFRTDEPDNDVFDLGAGLGMQFANNVYGFLEYSQIVGLDLGDANLLTVGIRGTF